MILALQPEAERQTAPVAQITAAARLTANPALVSYTLHDAEGDACSVSVEYAVGSGGAFHPATPGAGGDGASGLAPGNHAYAWDFDSDPDIVLPETAGVVIRVTATDSTGRRGEAVSTGHVLGNAPPSIESIAFFTGELTGTATLIFLLADTQSDTAEIQVQLPTSSASSAGASMGRPAARASSASTRVEGICALKRPPAAHGIGSCVCCMAESSLRKECLRSITRADWVLCMSGF